MTAYHIVPLAFVVMLTAAWLSYHERHKTASWFPFAIVGIGVVTNLLWATAARWTPDKRELFSVSAVWDAAAIVAYNVLPLVAFGVRLSPPAMFGFVPLVIGAGLIKRG